MKTLPSLVPVLALAALAGGCGGLLRSTAAPEQSYYLNAPALPAARPVRPARRRPRCASAARSPIRAWTPATSCCCRAITA
jgi:hypothetical protein